MSFLYRIIAVVLLTTLITFSFQLSFLQHKVRNSFFFVFTPTSTVAELKQKYEAQSKMYTE